MPWNNDPLMVAGGAMVGIDPMTGKMRDSTGKLIDAPVSGTDGSVPSGTTTPGSTNAAGGKWVWNDDVGFLGPDVPENPMGRQAGPWMPPVGSDVSMYRPDFRQVISDASHWEPDEPAKPPTPTADIIKQLADKARGEIGTAFTSYGAKPADYNKDIEDKIAAIIAGIPANTTTNLETYFPSDIGTKLISDLETGRRNKLITEFESNVPKTFVPLTSDDAIIESIIGEQRVSADDFIKNMLARGQISESGAESAKIDLDRQAGLGRTKLTEIGTGLINTEEGVLNTERGKRKTNIDTLKLTDPYDTKTQATDLGKLATDFIGTLGEGLRSGLGSTPIFDTTGLQRIGGGSSGNTGGGRTTGTPGEDEEDDISNRTGNQLMF